MQFVLGGGMKPWIRYRDCVTNTIHRPEIIFILLINMDSIDKVESFDFIDGFRLETRAPAHLLLRAIH